MTRHERRFVAHRPQPFRDGVDELLLVAVRKVPAADRAAEKHVPHERQLRFAVMEDDVAWRVPGAVADVEGEIADARMVAVDEPSRRLEGLPGDAVLGAVLGEPVYPIAVGLVRPLD